MSSGKDEIARRLADLGFMPVAGERARYVWPREIAAGSGALPENGKNRAEGPASRLLSLRIREWGVRVDGEHVHLDVLRVHVDLRRFESRLLQALRAETGHAARLLCRAEGDGHLWVILETSRAHGKRPLTALLDAPPLRLPSPRGIVGFKLALGESQGQLTVGVSDVFAFGHVPPRVLTGLHAMLREALSLEAKDATAVGVFECRYDLARILARQLPAQAGLLDEREEAIPSQSASDEGGAVAHPGKGARKARGKDRGKGPKKGRKKARGPARAHEATPWPADHDPRAEQSSSSGPAAAGQDERSLPDPTSVPLAHAVPPPPRLALGAAPDAPRARRGRRPRLEAGNVAWLLPKTAFVCEFRGGEGWDLAAEHDKGRVKRRRPAHHEAAIEVLEEREMPEASARFAALFHEGRLEACRKLAMDSLADPRQPSLFWMRRVAMLAVLDRATLPGEDHPAAKRLAGDLLHGSARLREAVAREDGDAALKALSRLAGRVSEALPGFEDEAIASPLLPELLGDYWFAADPLRAAFAYKQALGGEADEPRLVAKAIAVARAMGDGEVEAHLLEELARLTDHEALHRLILMRLAALHRPHDMAAALAVAERAWLMDRARWDVARSLAELFLEAGQAMEAIRVLNDAEAALRARKEPHDRAAAMLMIGVIWQTALDRPELAEQRFREAIALMNHDKAFLERVPEAIGRPLPLEAEAARLEALCGIALANQDEASLQACLPPLLRLYQSELQDLRRAVDLYARIVPQFALSSSEIHRMLAWDAVPIDWRAFYGHLRPRLDAIAKPGPRAEYALALADVTWLKLKDHDETARLCRVALFLGYYAPRYFDFLRAYFLERKDAEALTALLKSRIRATPRAEKHALMHELLMLPNTLGEAEREEYAVAVYASSLREDRHVHQILLARATEGAWPAFDAFFNRVLAETPGSGEKASWHKAALDYLDMGAPPAMALAEAYVAQIVALSGDDYGALVFALETLAPWGDDGRLLPYVKKILDANRMVPLPPPRIIALLRHEPFARAQYLEQVAFADASPDRGLATAREAVRVLQGTAGSDAKVERLLMRIGQAGRLSLEENEELNRLVMASQNWVAYEKLLYRQLAFHEDMDAKAKLWRWLLALYQGGIPNVDMALKAYQVLFHLVPDPEILLFEAADYAKENGPPEKAKPYCYAVLDDTRTWRHVERVFKVLSYLIYEWNEGENVKAYLLPRIEAAKGAGDRKLAVEMAELLAECGVINKRLAWIAIEIHAMNRAGPPFVEAWQRFLPLLADMRQTRDLLGETKALLARHDLPFTVHELIEHVLGRGLPRGLALGVASELKITLALKAFEDNTRPGFAQAILWEEFQAMPDDARLWLPLYFLLRSAKEDDKVKGLLGVIVPRLEADPSPLKNFPVTLESLRAEWTGVPETPAADVAGPLPLTAETAAAGADASSGTSLAEALSPVPATVPGGLPPLPDLTGMPPPFASPAQAEAAPHPGAPDAAAGVPPAPPSAATPTPPAVPAAPALSPAPAPSAAPARPVPVLKGPDDWRPIVLAKAVAPGMTQSLMELAFPSELEKHVALQCFALLSGELGVLEEWQYRVWRYPAEAPYEFEAKARVSRQFFHPLLRSPLFQLVTELTPLIVEAFPQEFTFVRFARKIGIRPEQLMDKRQPMLWGEDYFKEAGLSRYKDNFNRHRFVPFALDGLGTDIFYDGRHRAIYFDAKFYRGLPRTHAFHNLSLILRSVKLGFYVPLTVDPVRSMWPLISLVRRAAMDRGWKELRNGFGPGRKTLGEALRLVDMHRIGLIFRKMGSCSESDVRVLWQVMQSHVLKLQLAETLDLVGMVEALLGRDLMADPKHEPLSLYRASPHIPHLVEFMTQLLLAS